MARAPRRQEGPRPVGRRRSTDALVAARRKPDEQGRPMMKFKTLAVTAAIALAAITAAAAPAAADPVPSGCELHLETVLGGVCVPLP